MLVCEAFAGNIVLKMLEGVSDALVKKIKGGMMENLRSKIGAMLVKPALKRTLKGFSTEEYGGAPLLGLNGLVVKTHGSSKAEKLKKVIAEVLNVDPDEITMETTFMDDLGADSLDLYQIIMGIEEEFDIEIPSDKAEKITTVEEAVELIKDACN